MEDESPPQAGDPDLPTLEAAFRNAYERASPELMRLEGLPGLRPTERRRIAHLHELYARGFQGRFRRLTQRSRDDLLALVREFIRYDISSLLLTGAARAGDFLNNQLRGLWAERVVLTMSITGLSLFPFGPSGAAMPGEAGYREVVRTYREIQMFEGKRPDVIGVPTDRLAEWPATVRERVVSWPRRRLSTEDHDPISQAAIGIEVKNSTWHYARRREAGGGSLAITAKEEELRDYERWSLQTGLPVVFIQVLFDELYCMSFRRMLLAIDRGHVYREGDYLRDEQSGAGGKLYHRFFLEGDAHLCGRVEFPSESIAHVRVLNDGSVVPYLEFNPARALDVRSDVIWREIGFP